MNERQKEVLASQLKDEQRVLKELKQVYTKAREDVTSNIKALEARTDVENLQAIVYQKNYQEALKKQLDAILDEMNGKQFTSISEYLTKSYEDGFFGTMYDLHGQGIPLIIPIDQDQAARAIQLDSKISEGLYERLGVDTKTLKNSIRANVSRGIASSTSWAQVARNIQNRMAIGMNRAMRIARTEGHRIQNESRFDAQKKAKERGADIVKQWDSTLDKRTRPTHQELDGQVHELEEPYVIPSNGRKAMFPGGFGVAAEDINCRCASLQRAKWALDEDELQTLKERAQYFNLDKTQDFDDFKWKYIKAVEITDVRGTTTKLKASIKDDAAYQEYIDMVGANPDIAKLYENADDLTYIKHVRNGGVYKPDDVGIEWDYRTGGESKWETLSHEYGHFVDAKLTDNFSELHWNEIDNLQSVIPKNMQSRFPKNISYSDEFLTAMRHDKTFVKNNWELVSGTCKSNISKTIGVQDALDGMGFGRIAWGHGEKYYNRKYTFLKSMEKYTSESYTKKAQDVYKMLGLDASSQAKTKSIMRDYETASELWANLISAETCGGEALEYAKQLMPESYSAMKKIIGGK